MGVNMSLQTWFWIAHLPALAGWIALLAAPLVGSDRSIYKALASPDESIPKQNRRRPSIKAIAS